MAETFEAIRTGPSGFSQRVCLKLVLPFFRDSPDFIELFQQEARLAAKLRHSNIVGVIDFGQIEGTSYMALEIVDGVDLQVLLDAQPGKRLPHEYVVLLGHSLASALEHAHNPPASSDTFGVAKAVTGTSHKQSAVKGKVPYMSPEQLRAQPLDGRADLFALGVVLFEALSGQRPYEGPHDPATIMLTLEGDHPSLQELCPDAPPEFCKVIESLIESDRDRRPETAARLIELLDEFAPSPRVRRQLGRMVEEKRKEQPRLPTSGPAAPGYDSARFQSDAPRDETGIQVSGPTAKASAALRSGRRLRRKRALWLIVLVLAVGASVGAAFLFLPAAVPPPTMVPAPTTAPTPTPPTAVPKPTPVPTREATTEEAGTAETGGETVKATRPAPALPKPARVTVVVFPWGNVWINGKPQGAAPLKDHTLKPGRYQIGAGQATPTETKTVRLGPGQRKTISFDLTK
jgi:serine/threonine-protein kinase